MPYLFFVQNRWEKIVQLWRQFSAIIRILGGANPYTQSVQVQFISKNAYLM